MTSCTLFDRVSVHAWQADIEQEDDVDALIAAVKATAEVRPAPLPEVRRGALIERAPRRWWSILIDRAGAGWGERQEESRKAFLFEQEVESNLNSGLPFKALYSSKVPLSSEQQRRVGKEELDALDAVTNKELGQRWRTLSYGAIALALFGLSAAGAPKLPRTIPSPKTQCERVKAELRLNHATLVCQSVRRGTARRANVSDMAVQSIRSTQRRKKTTCGHPQLPTRYVSRLGRVGPTRYLPQRSTTQCISSVNETFPPVRMAGWGVGGAALAKDSAVGKAMFALFLLVFAALAAQVFVEQDKLLASRPFDPDDDDM